MKLFISIFLILLMSGCSCSVQMEPSEEKKQRELEAKWDREDKAYFKAISNKIKTLNQEDISVEKLSMGFLILFDEYQITAYDSAGDGQYSYDIVYKGVDVPISWEYSKKIFNLLKNIKKELQVVSPGELKKRQEKKILQELLDGN